jgi:hypothetical protein
MYFIRLVFLTTASIKQVIYINFSEHDAFLEYHFA